MREAIGTGKIFKEKKILIEGNIEDVWGHQPGYGKVDLPYLAAVKGNPAAINACDRENYTIDDAPFYYGKVGQLGYIISHKDFKFKEETP